MAGDEILKLDVTVNADTKGVKELKENLNGVKSSATDAAGGIGKAESGSKKLSKTTTETAKNTEDFKEQLDKTGESMALTTEHIKVLVEAMIALKGFQEIKESLEFSDEMGKTATKIGMTVEEFSALAHAAKLADIDTGTLAMGLQFLNKNAADAATGTGAAYDAFSKLGISVKDASGNMKSTKELFMEITGAINSVGDASTRTNILMALMGRAGNGMYTLMKDGVEGVSKGMEDAYRVNDVVTESMAANAEKTNDQITNMNSAFDATKRLVADGLAPVMYDFAKELEQVAIQYNAFLKTPEGEKQLKDMENLVHDGAVVMSSLAKSIAWMQEAFGGTLGSMLKLYITWKAFGMLSNTIFDKVKVGANGASQEIEKGLITKVKELPATLNGALDKTKDMFSKMFTKTQTREVNDLTSAWSGFGNATKVVTEEGKMFSLNATTLSEKIGLLKANFGSLFAVISVGYTSFQMGMDIGEDIATGIEKAYEKLTQSTDEDLKKQKELNRAVSDGFKGLKELDNLSFSSVSKQIEKVKSDMDKLRQGISDEIKKGSDWNPFTSTENNKVLLYIHSLERVTMEFRVLLYLKKSLKSDEELFGDINKQNESLKKITETMDKQVQSFDDRYNVELKVLKASGDTARADQLEASYSRLRSQIAVNGYNNQIRAIDNMAIKLEQYTHSETVDAEKVKQLSKQVADAKKDAYTKAMAAITQSLDYYVSKEKQVKDNLKKLADESLSIQEKYEERVKSTRQTGMTDEQKQLDNRLEILKKIDERSSLSSQIRAALASGDIETAKDLEKRYEDLGDKIEELGTNYVNFFKTSGKTQWVQEMAGYVDTTHQATMDMINIFKEYNKNDLNIINPHISKLEADLQDIQQKYSEIDVKLEAIGMDAVKQQYESLKKYIESNHIKATVETSGSTAKGYYNGGLIDGGYLPGHSSSDVVDTRLALGEFVSRNKSVAYYGAKIYHDMNAMRIPKEQLYAAYRKVKPIPTFNLPSKEDIEIARQATIIERGGNSKPTETVVLEINLGGATLTARTTKDELAEYEKHARRMRLCIPKKR